MMKKNRPSLRTLALLCFIICVCTLLLYYVPMETYMHKSYHIMSIFNSSSLMTTNESAGLRSDGQPNFIRKFLQDTLHFIRKNNNETAVDKSVKQRLTEISDMIKIAGINCSALFEGKALSNVTMETHSKKQDGPINDASYVNLTSRCEEFQTSRGYIMSSLTKEEKEFPIAYSVLVYKEAEMVERLLRAIYRPQNYYCIHVDGKGSDIFYKAMVSIASCFPNVFVASRRIEVWHSTFTVLEPELLCMEELWKFPKWKYLINLTGQEFPLKTNSEIVKILTAFHGASDVQTLYKCAQRGKWRGKRPPYGLRVAKTSVHIIANRFFIDYILRNNTAKEILEWSKYTKVPDETYFGILNANPSLGIKGTYTGDQDSCDRRESVIRYKMWQTTTCAGRYVRRVCILSTGDLPRLTTSKHLFANKFFLNEDRTVIGCLEEKVFNDTRDEYIGVKTFDTSFYSNLEFVKHQLT